MNEWESVIAAVRLSLGPDRDEGRRQLLACWRDTSPTDHARRCVIAHYLADLEPGLADEVHWDELALAAHADLGDTDLVQIGIASAAGLAPSLHLNLGDGYLRQGRVDEARRQWEAGSAAATLMADNSYGRMIRKGLRGLDQRLTDHQDAAAAD